MASTTAVIETFEGKAKRILWLPSITLGYIFTISGNISHFGLAVTAIGGARLFVDILESDLVVESDNGQRIRDDALSWFHSNYSTMKSYLLATLAVLYFISIPYSIWVLYSFFNHENPVLVGIAGIYCGILVIVMINL